jgi:NAD(P)-dependent dehydrogenase (short-subunit alcohol dehydrogenase family)
MDLGISGKRALGLGIAKALADEGAHVLLCGRSAAKLKANAEAINAAGRTGSRPILPTPALSTRCSPPSTTSWAASTSW